MRTTERTNVTKADATKVLNALKRQQRAYIGAGYTPPVLVRDWDWMGTGHAARWSIVWEEGPFEWAHLFPHGGIEEEFGFKIEDVSERMPSGVFAEPITSWAVAVWPI